MSMRPALALRDATDARITAMEARAIDTETRMARARALLADLMDEIGDAPFGVLAALVEIANELEAENG